MIQTSTDGPSTPLPKSIRMSKAMVDKAANLAQIQVNNDILTVSQLARLKDIHKTSIKAFDDVMTGEYTNKDHPYLTTFSFREENMAPPYKIWVPQFNRGCQDLMQDKCCDTMTVSGVTHRSYFQRDLLISTVVTFGHPETGYYIAPLLIPTSFNSEPYLPNFVSST